MSEERRAGFVRCSGVSKRFGRPPHHIDALSDVSLEVGPGSSTAFIGRNGAGKSTLLRVLAGITSPSAGQVERSEGLASVIELAAGFEPDLTGRENLRLVLSLAGTRTRDLPNASADALELAGIGDAADMPVKHYSTGMLARLSLGVAIASRPSVLLIDEVLAVGDLAFQRSALTAIGQLCREGTALILVTHSLYLARVAARRAIWFDNGSVVDDGPVDRVTNDYDRLLGASRERSGDRSTRIVGITLTSERVQAGEVLGVQVVFEHTLQRTAMSLQVELRPPVAGEEGSEWMRSAEEDDREHELNRIGASDLFPIDLLDPGRYVADLELDGIPLTSCVVDLCVVLIDRDSNEILDDISTPLEIGEGGTDSPKLLLSVARTEPTTARFSPQT